MRLSSTMVDSTVPDLAKLRLYALPQRPIAVVRAVRFEKCFVQLDAKGRVYSSEVVGKPNYWTSVNRLPKTIECLIRLDVLSAEAIEQHRAAADVERKAQTRQYAANDLRTAADALGVPLSATQKRALRAAGVEP